ncbi:unnamed protein product [Cercospora beticola]|nr:unnamed protein product [Cercospora beticola]
MMQDKPNANRRHLSQHGNSCRHIPGSSQISKIYFTFCEPHRQTEDKGLHPLNNHSATFSITAATRALYQTTLAVCRLVNLAYEAQDLFPTFWKFHPPLVW